jgi:hypothetical protein
MRKRLRLPVRSVDVADLQDLFLICAVATILVIRTQLWLTNYPQLGGRGLHIAHLLWGGLLMMIAIGMFASFLGRPIRRAATAVGGIGFGFFIDELGKFITEDNNYFFKPAAGLIYATFVILYLVTRAIQRRHGFTSTEYLVNALDLTVEAARRDLDQIERRRALVMLDRADPDDPLVEPVRRLLEVARAREAHGPSRLQRFVLDVRNRYFRVVDRHWFELLVEWAFSVWAVLTLARVASLIVGDEDVSTLGALGIVSSGAAGVLVVLGVREIRRKRRAEGLRWFERALLVQILITQVFEFVESQFTAVFGLGFNLLLLITLRYMMRRERQLEVGAVRGPDVPQTGSFPGSARSAQP